MNALPTFAALLARAQRDRRFAGKLEEGVADVRVLAEAPYSPEADRVLERIVGRYCGPVIRTLAREDLLFHPNCHAWLRLLQVRFLQLACHDRPTVAAVIQRELAGGQRPRLEKLMGEVFRHCFIEMFAWGRAYKDTPEPEQAPRPKPPDHYWREALQSLDADVETQVKQGKQIADAPAEWYALFGIEYRP